MPVLKSPHLNSQRVFRRPFPIFKSTQSYLAHWRKYSHDILLFFKNFIYLFIIIIIILLAVLGLRFCARAFSSCGKRGPLFIAVRGPLTAEHRLQMHRLSSCGSRAQLLRGMWDLPRPGLEPVSPALAGGFSTTVPPGKPHPSLYINPLFHQGFNIFICSHHMPVNLSSHRKLTSRLRAQSSKIFRRERYAVV